MLMHPTLDQMRALRLDGMAQALEEQHASEGIEAMRFEDRLALLLEREASVRRCKRLTSRLRQAKLRHRGACIEDLDFRAQRGLDRRLVMSLASCEWVRLHRGVLITGATGVGKTYLACALAQKACREDHSALYARLPRLLEELRIAHGDGRYPKLIARLAKVEVLVLDDWGLAPLSDADRREILEILEERHERRSTVIASQLPVAQWHDALGHPALADAILDRLVHNAYHLELRGESMRKLRAAKAGTGDEPREAIDPEFNKGKKGGDTPAELPDR